MSDLHLLPDGKRLLGHDCAQRLRAAVAYVAQHHADADFCIVTGDVAEEGDAKAYQLFNDIMSHCPVQVLAIPGNHDNRKAMRSKLSLPDNCHPEFIQYSVIKNNIRLILLDSLQVNNAEGFLCKERLSWLETELSTHRVMPTLVFTHHPPAKLYLPAQDQNQNLYGDKLLELLHAADNVQHLFFGHVHRPVSGNFHGLSFTALQSIALQAPLPYPSWDWDSFTPANEAPAIGLIHASPSSVVVHFDTFGNAFRV